MSRIHAHRLIESADIAKDLLPIGNTTPTSEGQIRPLAKLDENLMRSELTPTEYAEHMQRRKEIWEAMQVQSGQVVPIESKREDRRGHRQQEFAEATEKATGQSKRNTNRATRRAREICQQARDLIRGTKLDREPDARGVEPS